MPDCCRRAVSGSIMQKKKPVRLDSRAGFCAVLGLIVWGCGRCTASSVGGWVSDLGRVGVCWAFSCRCCGAARAWRLCGFGILPNKFLQRKGPCMYRTIACKSSVLYIRLPCLQALGPLQEHTTFRESLVCYTSPPGGVYVLGVFPCVFIIRSAGRRGRYGFALPGAGRPARSTGPDCPGSPASRARHSSKDMVRLPPILGFGMIVL